MRVSGNAAGLQRKVQSVKYAITATLLSVVLALSATAEMSRHPLPWRPHLADLLKQEVPNASIPPVELQATISDYAVLNDTSYFILGYYAFSHPEPDSITPPLRVLLLDKQNNSWRNLEIQGKPDADGDPKNECLGTVLGIKSIGEKFFIETHMTPSASCQFVLSHSLKLEHILFGWPMQVPSSSPLLIQGNTAHFAATHALSLSLYDPATATETSLLPLNDDRAMKWIDDDLSDLINDSWCRENNSPCEASGLGGAPVDVFVNDKSNAVAMHIQYIGDGMGPRAKDFKADVIYVFDLSSKKTRHREFESDVVQKIVGKYDMQKLTQPSILRQLFSQHPPVIARQGP